MIPQALQHILQKSSYNYPKRVDINTILGLLLGPGIFWAEGKHTLCVLGITVMDNDGSPFTAGSMHQRHRKVMSPAFSVQQLRTFIPLFQSTTAKASSTFNERHTLAYPHAPVEQVIQKWKSQISEKPDGVVLVNKWLARAALDIIGEGIVTRKTPASPS